MPSRSVRLPSPYDFHGNLKSRADKSLYFDVAGMARANDLKEEFVYDSRDRLTTATRTRLAGAVDTKVLLSQAFDALGNQTSRTSGETMPGFVSGAYEYRTTPAGCTQAGPHALSKVGATTWCYDANGNQTKETSSATDYRTLTWTGFDLPEKIVRRAAPIGIEQSTEFRYAPDRSRYKRIDRTISVPVTGQILKSSFEDGETDPQGPPATTITVGNVEFYQLGTTTRVRRNIGGFLIVFREGSNASTNQYVLHDGLGSVDAIVSTVSGLALLQKPSFDAYGLRRNGDNGSWNALSLATLLNNGASQVTLRGYTGHEQIDTAALVHMSGRLYDPRVGRFVQGDPLVDDPGDPQAYNRYAYVGNNPVSVIDPTGYSRQGARNAGGAIVGFIMLGLGPVGWTAQAVAWAAFQGALVGVIVTGNAQGAVWGAVSAVTFHGIGQAYPGVPQGTAFSEAVQSGAYWSKIAAHGAAAGTLNALQGGNFGHALVSAGASAALSPAFDFEGGRSGELKGLLTSAIIGGTASELVGGKFANGAVTAAFAYAFSSLARGGGGSRPRGPDDYTDAQLEAVVYGSPTVAFDLPIVPQWMSDFTAGFGDTLSFGGSRWIRGRFDIGSVDQTSRAYTAGEVAGIVQSTALGGLVGARLAGTAGKGMEFSHWIPARWDGPRSLLNGNYVSTVQHALADPYRYRFMPRTWKALNPMPPMVIQQWNRVPWVVKGASTGATYGVASPGGNQ